MFSLERSTALGRSGRLQTAHGAVRTPFFMPVGTAGAMKGLTFRELEELGANILLCNTYHLHLHPGENIVESAGGLHGFTGWDMPILTDSGGFQVFSLQKIREISDAGVHFRNHLNGDPLFLGPEESITIQHRLGADIIMCFDECPPSTAPHNEIEAAVDRTIRWAKKCKEVHENQSDQMTQGQNDKVTRPLLFGIIQGGLDQSFRKKCTEELIAIGFDGYAIGGLAVGETESEMYDVLDFVCPILPENAPRYLMGVGVIHQLKAAVAKGIDIFDCVLPMRLARHGTLILSDGSECKIIKPEFRSDHSIIDPYSPSALSRIHKKSYLHHLLRMNERYGETIACAQNLGVTLKVMRDIREHINNDSIPRSTE